MKLRHKEGLGRWGKAEVTKTANDVKTRRSSRSRLTPEEHAMLKDKEAEIIRAQREKERALKQEEKKRKKILAQKEKERALKEEADQQRKIQRAKQRAEEMVDAKIARFEERIQSIRDRIAESLAPPKNADPNKIECPCGGFYSSRQYWGPLYDSPRLNHEKTQMHQHWQATGERATKKQQPDWRLKDHVRCDCGVFISQKKMTYGKMRDDFNCIERHRKTKIHLEYEEFKHLL